MYLKRMQFGSPAAFKVHQTRPNQTGVTPDSDRSIHTCRKHYNLLFETYQDEPNPDYQPNIPMGMCVQSLKASVNICYSILDVFNALDILSMQLLSCCSCSAHN